MKHTSHADSELRSRALGAGCGSVYTRSPSGAHAACGLRCAPSLVLGPRKGTRSHNQRIGISVVQSKPFQHQDTTNGLPLGEGHQQAHPKPGSAKQRLQLRTNQGLGHNRGHFHQWPKVQNFQIRIKYHKIIYFVTKYPCKTTSYNKLLLHDTNNPNIL